MKTSEKLTLTACETIKTTIADAGQNEVFFVCSLDSQGFVDRVRAVARGDDSSVPALRPFIEKSDVLIHNHPSGDLTPSKADLGIASTFGNTGVGFYIVDNKAESVYVVAEPVISREKVRLDTQALAAALKPGGELSRILPFYEERETQVEMLELVCESLNSESFCIAEAGTGVGKSLAYLIPAMQWVAENEERIVVSTATINLQQQLLEKDIPLVKNIIGIDPKTVLVKGRGNYLCLKRLNDAEEETLLFGGDSAELEAIQEWSRTTESGSRSDLSFYPSDELWYRVCSDADTCHGLRCRHREGCFVLKSRREAASAQLLITNHHLLFSDLSVRLSSLGFDGTAVLPPFRRIIFDEAHNLESSATSYFSDSFSRFTIRKYLNRLYRRHKGRNFGLIPAIERLIPEEGHTSVGKVLALLQEVNEQAEILDNQCRVLLREESSLLLKEGEPGLMRSLLFEPLTTLRGSFTTLIYFVEDLIDNFFESDEEEAVFECRITLRRMKKIAEICERFGRFDDFTEEIFWLETATAYTGEKYVRFVISPLDIAPMMREAVFEKHPTVIFTSATLTVNGSFVYWKSRLGLSREALERSFPSPFDYRNRVLLGIPTDAPLPSEADFQSYASDFIRDVLEISEGRALVLFTSYSMLNATFVAVQPALSSLGISVLRQGDEDRNRLLVRFREETASVLFATDSFWEGVDAPGEALEVLVLCRLPFRVPTEPIFRARTEAVTAGGGNAFLELALPDTAIKLKQGFGRLMRRGGDYGIVLILDSRIVKRSYGEYLLRSLPETARSIKERKYLLEDIENFLISARKSAG